MADINFPISYSKELDDLLKRMLKTPSFSYRNWSDDDLAPYRKAVRDFYRTAQNGLCAFCKQQLSLASVGNCHVEHIVAKSTHPEFIFHPKNLCVICSDCNIIKRDKEVHLSAPDVLSRSGAKMYPRSSDAFRIVHPHFDEWDEHIEKFGSLYLDRTDKGLFTIGACTLNRIFRQFGWESIVASETDIRTAAQEFLDATDAVVLARKLQKLKRMLVLV